MKQQFPDAIIGTSEPFWQGMRSKTSRITSKPITRSVAPTFRSSTWISIQHREWPQIGKELEAYCRGRGIAFGMYYTGNWDAASDEAWLGRPASG